MSEQITTKIGSGMVVWERQDIPELRLDYTKHLRLLQGASLSSFFSSPYLLLQTESPPIWEVPYVLRNVVLALVVDIEGELQPTQIAAELTRLIRFS